ncbi:MAG TPA: DUF3099 domain-containing protein [Actinomycetales bacterium]|nr:DUF3099 domain-containing protein [Actinomycetales bacterium]
MTGRPHEPTRDITSPDVPRRLDDSIRARRRRYFWLMGPCLVLVVFGFFVPAPTPWRVGALAVAAVIPPVAAVVANVGRR